MNRKPVLCVLLFAVLAYLFYSGIHPYDRLTWFLEVLPVLISIPLLIATFRSYPLTTLLYVFIFIHFLILIMGGEYTYARVPLGFRLQEQFGFIRNPYDRIGHFAQGFVPAILAREILIRGGYITGKKMLAFIVVCICLAASASYELLEWLSAVILGQGAEEFLGTQGDVWDTQWDMFMALIGATTALLFFSKYHDRQISALQQQTGRGFAEEKR
jgi:putative membrane protein